MESTSSVPSHSRVIGIYERHDPIPRRVWYLWLVDLAVVACVGLAMLVAR